MVFNHPLGFVFLQNPKCASTYIEAALLKVRGSKGTRPKKHGNIRHIQRRLPRGALAYKIFGTVRNPLTFYPSLWSFTRRARTSHAFRYFPAENFDDYLKRVLNIDVPANFRASFRRFTGQHPHAGYSYGWATFSNIHWLTTTQRFGILEDNHFIPTFRMEDNFQSQISEYLGLDIPWPDKKINSFFHRVKLTDQQRQLILERDRPTFEKWYPEEL